MAIVHDLKITLRALTRARGYAFAVIAMIAVGVTAGAVLFLLSAPALRLVSGMLQEPLPAILPLLAAFSLLLSIVLAGGALPAAQGARTSPSRALRDE